MQEVVVAAIIRNADRVLLVQQRKPRSFALWSYPGGHVNAGENLLEALHREVKEEIGAKLIEATPLRVDKQKNRAGNYFEHHAFVGTIHGDIAIPADELMGFGWFSLPELEAMRSQLRAPFVLELAQAVLTTERKS